MDVLSYQSMGRWYRIQCGARANNRNVSAHLTNSCESSSMPTKPHLCVFFTKDVSLRTWDNNGTLDREVAIYRWLQDKGVKISFVTYGDKTDLAYADRLPGI